MRFMEATHDELDEYMKLKEESASEPTLTR